MADDNLALASISELPERNRQSAMTLSKKLRSDEACDLLQVLFAEVGDSALDLKFFDEMGSLYASLHRTSWNELLNHQWLESVTGFGYRFTPAGWSEAIIRAGPDTLLEQHRRAGELSRMLKRYVEDRETSVLIPFDGLVSSGSLPVGWVFNAIDSRLTKRLFGKREAYWFGDAKGRLVEIPRDFGTLELDLYEEVRARNAQLEEIAERRREDLEQGRADLAPYICSTCSSPLITQGIYEHEYGSDEFSEYECGSTSGGPNGDVPCRESPSFPKFNEYILTYSQDEAAGKWSCYAHANPASRSAGVVHLHPTRGSTESEARTAMLRGYQRRASPLRR